MRIAALGTGTVGKAIVSKLVALGHEVTMGSIVDLGDISTARGTEGHLLLWLRLWGALGTGDFNIKVAS